ncbi:FkbM family methyltransferase [Streptomyces sp. NPDC096153]|uniref:FkbM family methyltransferase n=1 Tax=Streptomyces sp. NPDC096153 TaxID=3155548 RepID=UPI003319798F
MSEQEPIAGELETAKLADGREIVAPSAEQAVMLWHAVKGDEYYLEGIRGLSTGDVVLDVGGNIGLTAMVYADLVPGIRIISAEPAPSCFAALRRNLERYVPDAVAVNAAVGKAPGTMELTYYPESPANSTLYADVEDNINISKAYMRTTGMREEFIELHHDSIAATFEKGIVSTVDVVTVGELAERHGVDEVALLKIDVERAELDVLEGVPEQLWPKVRRVVTEVHDVEGRLAHVRTLLRDKGFTVKDGQEDLMAGTNVHMLIATRD